MMDRRTFMTTSAIAILAAPLAVEAQQAGKVYRIGWLGITPPTSPPLQRASEAFLQGLRDHGFVEGQNAIIGSDVRSETSHSRCPMRERRARGTALRQ
jgi:hypothetical protein